MAIQHRGNHDLAFLKNERLHRIVRKVDTQVGGVQALELHVVVLSLVLDDLVAELAPRREIHPCWVGDHELGGSRGLPFVESSVGSVVWRDLPLYEAVHAHERGEFLWDKSETAPREDGGVAGHDLSQTGRFLFWGSWLVEEEVHRGECGPD